MVAPSFEEGERRCFGVLRNCHARLRALFVALAALSAMLTAALPANAYDPSDSSESREVINHYLAAAQSQKPAASMEVSIDATIPKLKKEGKLHALRKISQLGKVTYKMLGFQGDDSIKTEVIGRYLEAEQKGQGNEKLSISPVNYKFKFKGLHKLEDGQRIYVVFLTPRRKEIGLFKGEMWLDSKTYLPIMESGKFVKNPSVFFKRVEFVRDYKIENGEAVPQHMLSTIDARLVGKVNLTVNYSRYHQGDGSTNGPQTAGNGEDANNATPSMVK